LGETRWSFRSRKGERVQGSGKEEDMLAGTEEKRAIKIFALRRKTRGGRRPHLSNEKFPAEEREGGGGGDSTEKSYRQ